MWSYVIDAFFPFKIDLFISPGLEDIFKSGTYYLTFPTSRMDELYDP